MEPKQLPLIIIANLNVPGGELPDSNFDSVREGLNQKFPDACIFVTATLDVSEDKPLLEIAVINPNLFPDEQRQIKLLQALEELKTLNPNDSKITQCS